MAIVLGGIKKKNTKKLSRHGPIYIYSTVSVLQNMIITTNTHQVSLLSISKKNVSKKKNPYCKQSIIYRTWVSNNLKHVSYFFVDVKTVKCYKIFIVSFFSFI